MTFYRRFSRFSLFFIQIKLSRHKTSCINMVYWHIIITIVYKITSISHASMSHWFTWSGCPPNFQHKIPWDFQVFRVFPEANQIPWVFQVFQIFQVAGHPVDSKLLHYSVLNLPEPGHTTCIYNINIALYNFIPSLSQVTVYTTLISPCTTSSQVFRRSLYIQH